MRRSLLALASAGLGGAAALGPLVPTVAPSSAWAGTITAADLAAIPQAGTAVHGNGSVTTPPVGHFRRETNAWITSGDSMLGVSMWHGARSGMAYVELQLGVDGTPMRSYAMSRVGGRYAYWFNLANNPQTNAAGEILAIARGVPVNGTERVVSMRITLDTGNVLTNGIVPVYLGDFGSGTTSLDFTAAVSTTSTGTSKATAVATLYEAVFVAARLNQQGYSAEVRYAPGKTYTDSYSAAFGPEQIVARDAATSAALCNARRIDVVPDTVGGTCVYGRADRVFATWRGITFASALTAGGTAISLSGPITDYANHAMVLGGYALRHPLTGEARLITSSSTTIGAVTINCPFSTDVPAGSLVWLSGNTQVLPANNLRLDGVTIDHSTIATVGALGCATAAGVMWPQFHETRFGRVDPNGWSGPGGFADTGYPSTNEPCGYFQPAGTTDFWPLGDTFASPIFNTALQVGASPSSLSALGFDGQRGTFGSAFAGGRTGTVRTITASGLVYSEDVSGVTSHDVNYHTCDHVRQFKHCIRQQGFPYYRQHYAKTLTVARTLANTVIVSGVESPQAGFTTLVMAEDPAVAGINGFAFSSDRTITLYNDVVHFLSGPLAAPWSTTSVPAAGNPPFHGAGSYTPGGQSQVVGYLTVKDPDGSVAANAAGATCVGYGIQHPDGDQWGSIAGKLGVISNTLLQCNIVSGNEVQNLFNDAEQNDSSHVLASSGGAITISGTAVTFDTAQAALNVGDILATADGLRWGVVTAAGSTAATLDPSSSLLDTSYGAGGWVREAGLRTAGTAVTFSSPVVITTNEFFGVNSGVHKGAYSRVSAVPNPLLNALTAGTTNTSGTMPRQLISPATLPVQSVDLATWTRWKKGKPANDVAIICCLFESKAGGGAIEASGYNWIVLQIGYGSSMSSASAGGLSFNNNIIGSGVESFTVSDSVLRSVGGSNSTCKTTYYGRPTPAVYLPYQGLILDNNRYLDANAGYVGTVDTGNTYIDRTGVTTIASGSPLLTPNTGGSTAIQAVFDETTLRPLSGMGLTMKGGPIGLPLVPFDAFEQPLLGLAANNVVGALQAA